MLYKVSFSKNREFSGLVEAQDIGEAERAILDGNLKEVTETFQTTEIARIKEIDTDEKRQLFLFPEFS